MDFIRNRTFYPELVVRLENDPQKENEILLDNGVKAKLIFDTELDVAKYFEDLATIKTNENLVNRKLKDLKKNKQIKKEIKNEIYKERPELKGIDPDEDEELYDEFLELMDNKLQEKAVEYAQFDTKVKKGSIIKLAGITDIKNNQIKIISKSLYSDKEGKPSLSGIYMFAVINRKLPLLIKQSKNNKPLVQLHPLVNINQFRIYVKNQITTLEATTQDEVKLRKKKYKLQNVPKPYITLNAKIKWDKTLQKAVEIINMPVEKIKEINISDFIKEISSIYSKEELKITHENQKYIIAFKYIKDYILTNFDEGVLKNINIYLPLGISEEEYKDMINVVLNGNKSGKEGRLGIVDSLFNTTFTLYKEHEIKIKEIIKSKYQELYQNGKLEFNATYTPEINTYVGFFPQNINTKNAVLSLKNYTEIINEVYKFTSSLKKNKN